MNSDTEKIKCDTSTGLRIINLADVPLPTPEQRRDSEMTYQRGHLHGYSKGWDDAMRENKNGPTHRSEQGQG